MIEVVVNGKESRKYAGKVKLEEIVGDLYPEGKILESITINGREIPLSKLERTVVRDGENVNIQFISLDEGIANIAKSALEFIEWADSQNMDDDHVFGNLSKLSSGFEIMENAIFSIESTGRKVKSEEESKEILKNFEEINSFTALEKKEEVREKVKKVAEIYRRIFSRILEGGTVNE